MARTQYDPTPTDLDVTLALVRGRTLAVAGERLGLDASTVFRSLQRLERGLGQPLFERTRAGCVPTELAARLAEHAEQMEAALESARSSVAMSRAQVAGTLRITTTDTLLHGPLAPALLALQSSHPLLDHELHTGNERASLTRRDADIAVRATRRRPPCRCRARRGGRGGTRRSPASRGCPRREALPAPWRPGARGNRGRCGAGRRS